MPSFYIEGKEYSLRKEAKAAVNVWCDAFPNGWKVFKRNSGESDEAIQERIAKAMAEAREVTGQSHDILAFAISLSLSLSVPRFLTHSSCVLSSPGCGRVC